MSGLNLTASSDGAALGTLLPAGQSTCSFHFAVGLTLRGLALSGIFQTPQDSHSLVKQCQALSFSSKLLLGATEKDLAVELSRSPPLTDALSSQPYGKELPSAGHLPKGLRN